MVNKVQKMQTKGRRVNKFIFPITAVFSSTFIPRIGIAAPRNLKELFNVLIDLINGLIFITSALAVLFFVWGIAQFILVTDSEEGRRKGKNIMFWGLIALFVLFSIWGILQVLDNTFFGGGAPTPSGFPPLLEA